MKRITLVRSLVFFFCSGIHGNISRALTYTNLFEFNGAGDGAAPNGIIQGSDGNFYGTVGDYPNGFDSPGAVFKFSLSNGPTTLCLIPTNDWTGPERGAALIQASDGNFYGTTDGYSASQGTVFKVSSSGTFTTPYTLDGHSQAGLVQGTDGNIYGTIGFNDHLSCGAGGIFRFSLGGALTNLICFDGDNGDEPETTLIEGTDGSLYGTTMSGGTNVPSFGTIFNFTSDGVLTNLHEFNGDDGYYPEGTLIRGFDGNFYGITEFGGTNTDIDDDGQGTVFRITPSGTFTNIHEFGGYDTAVGYGALVQGSDGNLYGITIAGGTNLDLTEEGYGTIFRIGLNGDYTNLYEFDYHDGAYPDAALVQGCDGNFYGTTESGGTNENGVIFRISVPLVPSNSPPNQISAIQIVGSNVVITVPSISGEQYRLQYSTSMSTAVWINVAGAGVSNSIGGPLTLIDVGGAINTQRFYRVDVFACSADAFSIPVGFVTLNITNTAGGGQNALGLPLEHIPSDQGLVNAVASNVVTVVCSSCAISSHGAESYVEFTSGSGQGRYFPIVSNDASGNLTLSVGSESLLALGNGGSIASDDGYAIHQFYTISEVLKPAGATPLHPATTQGAADNVVFYSPSLGDIIFYPRISGSGATAVTNWFESGSGNSNSYAIPPDTAFFVQRKGAGVSTNVVLVGRVPQVSIQTVLVGGGFNLVSTPYPNSTVVSNLNLGVNAGFNPGTTVDNADNIFVWNAANQGYDTLYYQITGSGASAVTNWNLDGFGVDPGYAITLGQGLFIENKSSGGYWIHPLQYTTP